MARASSGRLVLGMVAAAVALPARAQPPINPTLLRAAGEASAGGPLAAACARARSAVVHVFVEVKEQTTFKFERPSSGVVLTPGGLVVTWWDLVREAEGASDKTLCVQVAGPAKTRLAAKLVAHDAASGFALLQAEVPAGQQLTALALAGDPQPGDPAAVLGLPDGDDYVGFAGIVLPSSGPVQAGMGELARADVLLTDAAISARSHGAALLSADGALLGLCNAERVLPEVGEPTLADLLRPSFGWVIPTRALRRAFPAACAQATQAPPPAPSATARAVALAQDSIVAVFGGEGERPPLGTSDPYATQRRPRVGSGVVVDATGLVFTDRHLIEGAPAVTVTFRDGASCAATVLESDPRTNTALLQLNLPAGKKVAAIACGSAEAVAVGETVLALGNPEGHTLTVRQGVVSARRGGAVQTDAGLGNHNAGGALVSLDGELLAVIDGGARNKAEVAVERRGDEAKLETGLDLSPSIDALRLLYRTVIDRRAGPDATLAQAPPARPRALADVAAVVARAGDAVLNVYVEVTAAVDEEDNPFAPAAATGVPTGLGSGVIVDRSGLALTNEHVVREATEPDGSPTKNRRVRVRLRDGRVLDTDVLSISREEDLALLRLRLSPDEEVTAVELGASAVLAVGDQTVAIGNPHGRADTVTAGVVVARNQSIRVRGRWAKLPHLFETDAAINAGNSGGALLDGQGRLIGINSAGASLHAVTGFAIAVDHVREKLRGVLLSPEKLRSAYIGLDVLDHDGKVVVQSVHREGPALAAGLAAGDVVRAIAGRPVRWSVDFALAWLTAPGGVAVDLALERDGKALTKAVVPMSAAAWAVFRQTSLAVREVSTADDAALVHAAALAGYRRFTGDPTAAPSELPATLVVIERAHPSLEGKVDVRAGDVLLCVQLSDAAAGADAARLVPFHAVTDVQRCCNEHATYEGETLRAWLFRAGEVRIVQLPAKRLLP